MYIRARYGHGGRLGYERGGVPIPDRQVVVNSSIKGFTDRPGTLFAGDFIDMVAILIPSSEHAG
jgi:hypothetical protein